MTLAMWQGIYSITDVARYVTLVMWQVYDTSHVVRYMTLAMWQGIYNTTDVARYITLAMWQGVYILLPIWQGI